MVEEPEVLGIDSVVHNLVACPICGRTFRPEALERHQRICEKNHVKKRKTFDSSKQRAEGTEINTVPKSKEPKKEKPKSKSNWREKHDEFIQSIRAAKGVSEEPDINANNKNGNDDNRASKQPHVPAGYVQCPTCNRNFNERAADRHFPWCREQKNRMSKSPTQFDASERLKARTKYRAPLPAKKEGSASSEKKRSALPPKTALKKEPPGEMTVKGFSALKSTPPLKGDTNNNVRINLNANQNKNIIQNTKKPFLEKKKIARNNKNVSPQRKPIVQKTENLPASKHPIMKFKEKFPNHIHRNIITDDGDESYRQDLRELLKHNSNFSRQPKTVPGVRTGGKIGPYRSVHSVEDIHNLQSKFEDITASFRNMNGDLDANWAKKLTYWDTRSSNSDGLPQIGSSESSPQFGKIDPWAPLSHEDTRVSTGNSSSGSDTTLPLISRGSSGSEGGSGRLPRFCHQCGTKYPVTVAKYCCECGARRIANGMEQSVVLV